MSLDPHAAGLYPTLDPEWRDRMRRAGWLTFVPVVGWPMVLGYRKALTDHFFQPLPRAMPEWSGRHAEHFWNGVRAILVIQGYLAPIWLALLWIASSRGYSFGPASAAALGVCVLAPIFTNVALPWAILMLALPLRGGPFLGAGEAFGLTLLVHVAIFAVPAGFLRVSATGRFRSAFAFHRTLPFIARRTRGYALAWWYGLWMNWPAVPATLVRPWALFWAYVASLAVFNQLLEDEPVDASVDRPRGAGWLARAAEQQHTERRESFGVHVSPVDPEVRLLWTRWCSVPLPGRGVRRSPPPS